MDIVKKIAKSLVNDVYCLQENETLTITLDKSSDKDVISAILEEAHNVGGNGLAIEIAEPENPCAGVNSYVPNIVINTLRDTDCWLDAGSKPWIYSLPFEKTFAENKNVRYMIIGGIEIEGLETLFCDLDIKSLKTVTNIIKDKIILGKTMRFVCNNGTDLTVRLNHNHLVDFDIGDASAPGFHTPPASINIVPEFGSVNGKYVCEALMIDGVWIVVDKPVEFTISNSKITSIDGKDEYIENLNKWLAEKGDDNSDSFAHMSIGLSPNILDIKNNILYDERILGALNCGFGHVSPIDAPPSGQNSKTHFDSITRNISVWVDDYKIMDNGRFSTDDLRKFNQILRKNVGKK